MRKTVSVLLVIAVLAVSALTAGFTPRDAAKIAESDAKAIVLKDAGEKESDVIFTSIELSKTVNEDETSGYVYSVCFNSDTTDYEYELDAVTGELQNRCVTVYNFDAITAEDLAHSHNHGIMSGGPSGESSGEASGEHGRHGKGASGEADASTGATEDETDDGITAEEAQAAVLKSANLAESDVSELTVRKSRLGEKAIYRVSFSIENTACEYSVLASDGTIVIARVETDMASTEEVSGDAAQTKDNARSGDSSREQTAAGGQPNGKTSSSGTAPASGEASSNSTAQKAAPAA